MPKPKSTEIPLFQVFNTVVECGGFSAAKAEINVGQSTISRQIVDLKTPLGVCAAHEAAEWRGSKWGRRFLSRSSVGERCPAALFIADLDDFVFLYPAGGGNLG